MRSRCDLINETKIAIRFIFVSLAMNVIQLDIKNISNGQFKIKEPYINQLEKMHTLASTECRNLKKRMRDQKISVITINKRKDFTDYQFLLNGRSETKTYSNHIIKRNVKIILEELIEKS